MSPAVHPGAVRRGVAAAVLVTTWMAGCTRVDVPSSLPGRGEEGTSRRPSRGTADCDEPPVSLRPIGPPGPDVAPGTVMSDIRGEGRLRIGVTDDAIGFSGVDPTTGEVAGFGVDLARAVADALLGDPDAVELVTMTHNEQLDALGSGRVDLVAAPGAVPCPLPDDDVAFSTPYFTARRRMLVAADGPIASFADLATRTRAPGSVEQVIDRRVCAPGGVATVEGADGLPDPPPLVVGVPEVADCLVLLQQGQVDAVVADEVTLAGLAAQDPRLRVRGDALGSRPYALALPPGAPAWVRYVNAVLEDVRVSGAWADAYERWLADALGPSAGPPDPAYAD